MLSMTAAQKSVQGWATSLKPRHNAVVLTKRRVILQAYRKLAIKWHPGTDNICHRPFFDAAAVVLSKWVAAI